VTALHKARYGEVARFLLERDRWLLTTHVNPEGDAIGSEVALKAFLEARGKEVVVVNSSPTPANCAFLDPKGEIQVYPDRWDPSVMEWAEGLAILDVNGWVHLGAFAEAIRKSSLPRLCIDHHQGFENEFVDLLLADTTAAAAGVLVYELIQYMGGPVTPWIAQALYTSLVTDTGSFRYSNTDARAFRMAAELVELGADPFTIHRKVFGNRSWGAARLIAPVMQTLESRADGRIAWIVVTREMFDRAQAAYEDSDGLIDLVRAIRGVDLCLFFKETAPGRVKVSLRSNGRVDAYRIARAFGGGGHRMAAGLEVNGSVEEAVDRVIRYCLDLPEFAEDQERSAGEK
jgi:phosphoesterase RecJ-like protein